MSGVATMNNQIMAIAKAGRDRTMSGIRRNASSHTLRRLVAAAVLTVAAGALQGCGSMQNDGMSTGSIPDDYRTRHPITLTEVEHTIDVPVASGDHTMTIGTRDAITGFANDYRTSSSGSLQIQYPQGSMNSGAASHLRRELRQLLGKAGVSPARIIETSYTADASGDAAPIRLAFVGIRAVTDECGTWPEDIANNTVANKNYHNFGCATQNNLAAQIASPMDLVAPRGMTPIDATQRSNVITTYRDGDAATN